MDNLIKDEMYPFGLSGNQFLSTHNSIYIQSEILASKTVRVIECDIEEKWMKVREKRENEMDWIEMEDINVKKEDIIDLNENGVRWEGDSLNGNPYGYGCIYDEENHIIFKGFMFEGKKVCYGKDIYGDNGLCEYEGGYYKGMRFGYGRLYNKKNELIYEGEWKNNNPLNERRLEIHEELKEEDIHFGLEEIVIGENCLMNVSCFKLIGFNNLKKLVIHKNYLERMKLFCIENCNELVDVIMDGDDIEIINNMIAAHQNHINDDDDEEDYNYDDSDDDSDDDDNDDSNYFCGLFDEDKQQLEYHEDMFMNNKQSRMFRIRNCPNCEDVIIGDNWFANCDSAELNSIFIFYDLIDY